MVATPKFNFLMGVSYSTPIHLGSIWTPSATSLLLELYHYTHVNGVRSLSTKISSNFEAKMNYLQRRDMPIFLHRSQAPSKIYQTCAFATFLRKSFGAIVRQSGNGFFPRQISNPHICPNGGRFPLNKTCFSWDP